MLKLLSLFSGIGAFEKALDNLEVPYDLVAFCEFDKYATKSYCAIHGVDESKNLGDVTKVDETKLPKDIDILTYGFPCQDISLAGKQKGLFNEDGSQTRSGLFFDALRIIEATKPKIAIAENVKNLVSKKFNAQFQVVLASLDAAGYNNYWAVLNAKDFGIPQNRERVFIVSIRKDIDTGKFEFPAAFPLEKRLKDVLEEVVDEKYYLSENTVRGLDAAIGKHTDQILRVGSINSSQDGVVVSAEGIAPTHTAGHGNTPNIAERQPFVTVREATKQGYAEAYEGDSINLEQLGSKTRRGRVGHGVAQTLTTLPQQAAVVVSEPTIAKCVGGIGEKKFNGGQQFYQQDRVYQGDIALAHPASIPGGSYHYVVDEPVALDEQNGYIRKDGCVGTITTDGSSPKHNNRVIEDCLRIRKLTPKECFRLMGFDDEAFHKAEAVNSNTQLYKQAGNSIVVDVLEELFCMMLDESGNLYV